MMAAMSPSEPRPATQAAGELDRATLERCIAGDPIAFRAFVVRYQRPVFALLSRMVGRGPETEDLAQETFLRAFRALPGFDAEGPARPSTWLLTIATRLALDSRKKKRPELRDETPEAADSRASPERDSARAELRRAIARAVEALPDDQRAAFVLAEFHGFSMAEIGEALGAPPGTVKTRLFRAREKLAALLAPFEEDT
jgi:RNA polymerase sigma-70 factor (ECF subfamily)